MGTMTSEYRKAYTSFSGADIVATFTPSKIDGTPGKPTVIGELQGITYSVQREKAPVNP